MRNTAVRALTCLLAYGLLQWLYLTFRDGEVGHWLIDILTVQPSARVIQWLTPDEKAVASGHSLVSPHARLNILSGCEGTESLFLLMAAIIAYSASLRSKFEGVLWGTLLIWGLNQARIVALYYAVRHDGALFQLLHGVLAPTLIILCGCLYFLFWAQAANRRTPKPPETLT